jgi:hypothetical protein
MPIAGISERPGRRPHGRLSVKIHPCSWRRAGRGAASAEWLVMAPALLVIGFGVLQWALLLHGRASVEYAAFQGVRAGATRYAEPAAIIEGIAIGLIPIRDATLAATPVSIGGAAAQAILQGELASGVAAWRQLRPTGADFDDWAVPARDEEGRPLDGVLEIPNDNLRFRGNAVGPGSGRSLVESNLLEIELVYAWPMRVPLIGSLAVRWMEWFDRCAGAAEPATGYRFWGRADWRISGGAWRCPYYRVGGVPRWPLRVTASVRMHSPARHAGNSSAAEPVAGVPAVSRWPAMETGEDGALGANPVRPAEEPIVGEYETRPEVDIDTEPGAPGRAGMPETPVASGQAGAPAGAREDAGRVEARPDVSQPGECFSGQAEMNVGDEEAPLAAAVETLAAEAVAVQAR